MSRVTSPKSRRADLSAFDLLHSGVRRTICREDYTKLFTKIRIAQPKRQSFFPSSNVDLQQELQTETSRLKQQIKELQTINSQLANAISKQQKLQALLGKRIESQDLSELSFDKAMEIKLMLQANALQEQLKRKEAELNQVVRQHKQREERSKNFTNAADAELYAILCQQYLTVSGLLTQKEQILEQQQEKIIKTRQKTVRAREVRKARTEELKEMEKSLEKAKESLPNINRITDDNDSGIFGTQIRAKTTETLEKQIERQHQDCISFEGKIQQLIEEKVRQKIEVLKAINQYETLLLTHKVHRQAVPLSM